LKYFFLASRAGSLQDDGYWRRLDDQENNQYVCPQSALLTPCKSQRDTTMYISSTKDCKQLLGTSAELYNQMKDEMEQQYFKEKLYERMWKIEGIMNELKNYHD
jgi:hypothetical protein